MAMDVVNVLGNVAENTLAGLQEVVEVDEFARLLEGREQGRTLFLDVRGPQNARPFVEAYGGWWMNIPQEELAERLKEVPRDKDLIVVCNNGARSYEALLALRQAGLSSRNLQGGVGALKRWGWKVS
jgi:rhodanese-related sulfurtransferase